LVLLTLVFVPPAFVTWLLYRWPPAGVFDFLFEAK
jgi:hypothetical protein